MGSRASPAGFAGPRSRSPPASGSPARTGAAKREDCSSTRASRARSRCTPTSGARTTGGSPRSGASRAVASRSPPSRPPRPRSSVPAAPSESAEGDKAYQRNDQADPEVPHDRQDDPDDHEDSAQTDPTHAAPFRPDGRGLRRDGSPPDDQPIDDEQDDRADDRGQPRADLEELVERIGIEQHPGQKATEDRADDSDDRGHDQAAGIVTGQDRLGDDSREQSQDDEGDDSHTSSLTMASPGIPRDCRAKPTAFAGHRARRSRASARSVGTQSRAVLR